MSDGTRHLALAPLAAAAAAGLDDAVAGAARAALDAGCSADEIRETLLTVVPFCGYPRALDAIAAARAALGPAPLAADASSPARGAAFFDVVYGADAGRVRSNLVALDAEVAAWVEAEAYGNVLSRPGIPGALRERIGIVLLAAQGLRVQLSGHVRGALNFGATRGDVAAFIDAAAPFIAAEETAFARATLARVASAQDVPRGGGDRGDDRERERPPRPAG